VDFGAGDVGDIAEVDGKRDLWRGVALKEVQLKLSQYQPSVVPYQSAEYSSFLLHFGRAVLDH
jgi:hypothetical protein